MRTSWVIGAIEASHRAVWQIVSSSYPHHVAKFQAEHGLPEGWTEKLLHLQRVLGATCALGEFPSAQPAAQD